MAALGVDAIGVIGVAASPRWLAPQQRPELFAALAAVSPSCQGVLVVADPSDRELAELDPERGHRIVQLHGGETPQRCRQLRAQLGCPIWKALRLRQSADLAQVQAYAESVDALLLDAWQPDQLGGTGQRIPLEWLADFAPPLPWWLAGGVAAERVPALLAALRPAGLDASSAVERAPGDKDLAKVAALLAAVRAQESGPVNGAASAPVGPVLPAR